MKRFLPSLALIIASGVLVCCDKIEEQFAAGRIRVNVVSSEMGLSNDASANRTAQTKAIPVGLAEGDPVYLVEKVENWSAIADEAPATKGSIVTTSGLGTMSGFTTFGMEGFILDDVSKLNPVQEEHYVSAGTASKSGDSWVLKNGSSEEYKWIGNTNFAFWSYAPQSLFTPASFTKDGYSLTDYTVPTTVTSQQDLLLAYTKMNSGSGDAPVNVSFAHALAVVRFKLNLEGCTLKSASVSGVSSKGNLSIGKTDGGDVTFTWSDLSTPATFSQEFADADFTDGVQSQSGNKLFFMIPQKNATGSKVTFSITVEKADHTSETKTAELDVDWQAGKIYTYILSHDAHTFEYTFTLSESSQASLSYDNTSSDSPVTTVGVTSTKKRDDQATGANHGWKIKSYKIGSGEAVTVNGTSFTDKGGLTVSKDGNNLKVTALKRSGTGKGLHDYWINKAGRTDNLTWSPENWTTATAASPIDLSKFDFKSEQKNAYEMTTANCYIIRHAGTYKLPLVYGSGVVDGEVDSQSYAPTIASGGTNGLTPFVNHLGAGITSAFIENNDGCVASSASIVWQDKAAVITGLSIVSGASAGSAGSYTKDNVRYLQFTVDKDAVCQNNAIIAIKDASGKIIWSWHIWTTNDPSLLSDPIPVSNHTGVEYDFFPMYNLGWLDAIDYLARDQVKIVLVQDDSDKTIEITVDQPKVFGQPNGCWYQFGRKDPMCTTDSPAAGSFTKNSPGKVSLQTAICNPDVFYWRMLDDWCSTAYFNLWTGKLSKTGFCEQDADQIKTVYDPSPVGYKVPASKAFTGFTTTGTNSTSLSECNVANVSTYNDDGGWYFYTSSAKTSTIFFPRTGGRDCDNGDIFNLNKSGYYRSTSPSPIDLNNGVTAETTHGISLNFNGNGVLPYGLNERSNGFAVRPVAYISEIPDVSIQASGQELESMNLDDIQWSTNF